MFSEQPISPIELIVVFVIVALMYVVPLWRILPRTGLSSWLSLLGFMPIFAIVLWWVVAFRKWPGEEKAKQ